MVAETHTPFSFYYFLLFCIFSECKRLTRPKRFFFLPLSVTQKALELPFLAFACTVKPVYSRHAILRTPGNSRYFFKEPAESRSKSHRKKTI